MLFLNQTQRICLKQACIIAIHIVSYIGNGCIYMCVCVITHVNVTYEGLHILIYP